MTTEQKIFLGQCFNNATHIVAALHGRESTELESNAMIAKMVKELTKALGAEMKDLFFPPPKASPTTPETSPSID